MDEQRAGSALVLMILAVDDLPRAKAFYAAAFGWPLAVDAPVYAEFQLPTAMRIGLYEREAFGRNTGQLPAPMAKGSIQATELYFHVDELHAAIDRLKQAGARELSPLAKRPWGDQAAYFADLDGNVLVLAQPGAPGAAA